jgi:hypothetical protein
LGAVIWIDLARDKIRWLGIVKAVMKLWSYKMQEFIDVLKNC